MKNKETAIERYKIFYENTTEELRDRLLFNDQLGTKIAEERLEEPEEIEEEIATKEDWMEMASNMPNNVYETLIDNNFNWIKSREEYTPQILNLMKDWISINKVIYNENNNNDEELPDVNPEELNRLQLFTYKLIDEFKGKKEQLLMILLGTAGTGKSFTVAAITKLYLGIIKRACPTAKAAFLIKGKKF
jgi:flagellar biosynthesis GTPase FlhF